MYFQIQNNFKMNKSKENLNAAVQGADAVDIENFASQNKKPPKGRKYKVRVNDDKFTFDQECVSGSDILTKAGYAPIECYALYQKLKGCDFEKISTNEKVDLTQLGIEKFTVKKAEVYHYQVDGESETTDLSELTPTQILDLAGIKPVDDYYLVQVLDNQSQISYRDRPDSPIKMKCPGLKFISVYRSTTPVA